MYARRYAKEEPDRPAVVMATSGRTLTYREYEERANRVAHLLRDAGLKRGDHFSVFMENVPEMLEIQAAGERIGLYHTLVNSHLSPEEVAYIVTDSQSKVLFSSIEKRDVAEPAAAACPGVGPALDGRARVSVGEVGAVRAGHKRMADGSGSR